MRQPDPQEGWVEDAILYHLTLYTCSFGIHGLLRCLPLEGFSPKSRSDTMQKAMDPVMRAGTLPMGVSAMPCLSVLLFPGDKKEIVTLS